MNIGPIVGLLLAAGPCDNADPGKGGFFAGLKALSSGCYEQRIDQREQAVEQREQTRDAIQSEQQDVATRSAAASEELDRLRSQHLALKRQLVAINSELAARRVELDSKTRQQLASALSSNANSGSDAERIASLRSAIQDARGLVEKLSSL